MNKKNITDKITPFYDRNSCNDEIFNFEDNLYNNPFDYNNFDYNIKVKGFYNNADLIKKSEIERNNEEY